MAIAAVGLVACNEDKNEVVETESSEYPRSETLYIGGFDWAPPVSSRIVGL